MGRLIERYLAAAAVVLPLFFGALPAAAQDVQEQASRMLEFSLKNRPASLEARLDAVNSLISRRQWRALADRGDPDAMWLLGLDMLSRNPTPVELAEVERLWSRAAELRHHPATTDLAWHLAYRDGVAKNPERSVKLLAEPLAAQDGRAMRLMGYFNAHGIGMDPSVDAAFEWWNRAARAGYVRAYTDLAMLSELDLGPEPGDEAARRYLFLAADAKEPVAMRMLALRHKEGRGLPQDDRAAVMWLSRAAEGGDRESMFLLATHYAQGNGVQRDKIKALHWSMKAARYGHAEAQYGLGVIYEQGQAVKQSDEDAARWYQMAAEQNFLEAQVALGFMLSEGRGIEQDHARAVGWFQRAADQGHLISMSRVAQAYDTGRGLPKSRSNALDWHRKAALAAEETPAHAASAEVMYLYGLQLHFEFLDQRERDIRRELGRNPESYSVGSLHARKHGFDLAEECLRWINRAADLDVADAKEWLRDYREKLEGS